MKPESKLHKQKVQTPMISTIIALAFLLQLTCIALWGISYNQVMEKEKACAWLVLESWLGMPVSTKNGQQLQLKPHSGGLEIQQQEKKIL